MRDHDALRGLCGGAAWLSSARAVRCRLKCHNERNPFRQLPSGDAGHSGDTATARCEEGGDDVKSARPLRPGLHTCYNGEYRESASGNVRLIMKALLSSDWRISHGAVNTFPGLVHTARQAMKAGGA